jgi:hypothetical protein
MTAYYDFFRKIRFLPGTPTTATSAVLLNSSISGTTLTVGTLQSGTISVGMTLTGSGVSPGTYVVAHISGSENGSTWEVNQTQTVLSTTVTGTLNAIPVATTIEADTVTDTATVIAGKNITFSVKDTIDPSGLDGNSDFTIDTVVINGPDYQTYIPLGTTKLRLEKDLGSDTSDIEFIPDPASSITINRISSNVLEIGSTSPTIPFSQEQIQDLAADLLLNGTHDEITVTYQDAGEFPNSLIPDQTSGSGIGAIFDIWVINNQYNARVTTPGSGYNVGETVTFFGTNFPSGTAPTNNLVLSIGSVTGSNGISTISVISGTPALADNIDLVITSTLSDVTGRGASTSDAITISNATGSSNTSTGALKITAGGLAVFENANVGGYVKATTFESTQATGTAPFTVASTTAVANLQAATASKWHTARTVTFTGDVTGSFSIDGSADVTSVALTVGADKVELGTDTTGNYVATASVSGNGLSGSSSTEGGTFTVSSNATSVNTGETIVFRDTSGNFSAGTITASLTGAASLNVLRAGDTMTGSLYTRGAFGMRSSTIAGNPIMYDVQDQAGATVLEIGRADNVAATTAIDIHTGSTSVDYDTRLEFTGGNGTTGNGTMTIRAASVILQSAGIFNSTATLGASTIEAVNVVGSALTGAVTLDVKTNAIHYYTANAAANWTLNFRGNASTTMNTFLSTGQAVTVVLLATQGGAAFYPTAFTIDGTAVGVTVDWLGGSAPTGGNASSIDSYSFTIIKTAASVYTILASQARFA